MIASIEQALPSIVKLCREFGVERLELFGSATTEAFDPERSDVDFLVAYPDDYDFGPWLARFKDFEQALSDVLGRDVDLVMMSALKNRWFRREAAKTRLVLDDASSVVQADRIHGRQRQALPLPGAALV